MKRKNQDRKKPGKIIGKIPEEFSVCMISHEDFMELRAEEGLGQIATPAITSLSLVSRRKWLFLKRENLTLRQVVIDDSFLPRGDDYYSFIDLLVKHELYEFWGLVKNREFFLEAQDVAEKNDGRITKAHRNAVKCEYKEAQMSGILNRYHAHWKEWLTEEISQMEDGEAKAWTQARLDDREKVYQEIIQSEAREGGPEKEPSI